VPTKSWQAPAIASIVSASPATACDSAAVATRIRQKVARLGMLGSFPIRAIMPYFDVEFILVASDIANGLKR
jgi:hypothetical protein